MRFSMFFVVSAVALTGVMSLAHAADSGPYKVVNSDKVGGTGGFDYVYADSDGRKLYVPRSDRANSRVDVYDLDTLKPLGTIPQTNGVHGVAVDPKSGHGFASSNPVVMFDTKTLATIKTIKTEGSPDGIFFEPATQRIYVLSHRSPNVTAINAADGSIAGTIDLGGAPEQGQSDGNGKAYIDLEDKDAVAVVDTNTMKVTATYDLAGKGGGPAGLGLDAKNGILFAFCHDPQTVVILNAADGKILTSLPIGNGVDGGGFNPNTNEAFSSQGDGTLSIIKETSPTSFEVEQTVQTKRGAKTCTLDTKTNQIYLITADYVAAPTQPAPEGQAAGQQRGGQGGPPGGRRGGRGRGRMAPDSFTILVVGNQ